MSEKVNIMAHWAEDDGQGADRPLELVRLGASETAAVPFTTDGEVVQVHYCDDHDIRGYLVCNGPTCVLCRAGRKAEERLLLPVYLPGSGVIGVLPISPSSRPGALRPQIFPALRAGRRVAFLIRKPDRTKFEVGTINLADGMDDGAAVIKHFLSRYQEGLIQLSSVFQRLDNRSLADVPGIAAMLRIKGIRIDDDGQD
jgi:hypothetical protein